MVGPLIRQERPDHPQVIALLDGLDRYLASLYPPEANHILDVQALLAPEVHFLVAEQDGAIVGCGAVRRMPGEPDTGGRPYGEVKRMVTAPWARGRGVASALMRALEAQLRAEGLPLALLETGEAQVEAVRLYERRGYRRRGPFGGYPDNGLSLFYEKSLA
jgi:putative acetyltransferase